MDISFYCRRCGQHILIEDSAAGASVNCPSCKEQITVPTEREQPKATLPQAQPERRPSGNRRGLKKITLTLCAVAAIVIVWFVVRGAWRAVRPNHNPIGKTEKQVARLYGDPIKVKPYGKDFIERTYLVGDILAEVQFHHDLSTSASYHKDSTSLFDFRRVTAPEAQKLLSQISGGRKWQVKETKGDTTRYECIESRRWHFIREFPWLQSEPGAYWWASYSDEGFLFVDGFGFGDEGFKPEYGVVDPTANWQTVVIARVDIDPRTRITQDMLDTSKYPKELIDGDSVTDIKLAAGRTTQNAIKAKEQIRSSDLMSVGEEIKPTALDVKGGFREYRLGMKRTEVPGDLTKEHSFTEDADEYAVDNFDTALGSFQIENIKLEFDRSLGILKEVRVWIKGRQNVAGVLEAFKVAYGEPEKGGLGNDVYSWRGMDIELRYSEDVMFDTTATATWTSKKIDKLIGDERARRAKEGATDAAKGL